MHLCIAAIARLTDSVSWNHMKSGALTTAKRCGCGLPIVHITTRTRVACVCTLVCGVFFFFFYARARSLRKLPPLPGNNTSTASSTFAVAHTCAPDTNTGSRELTIRTSLERFGICAAHRTVGAVARCTVTHADRDRDREKDTHARIVRLLCC